MKIFHYLIVCSQVDVGVGGSESPEGSLAKGNACLARQVIFEKDSPDFFNVLHDLLTVKETIFRGGVDHLLSISSLLSEPFSKEFGFGRCTFACLKLVSNESGGIESTFHSIVHLTAIHFLEDILDCV